MGGFFVGPMEDDFALTAEGRAAGVEDLRGAREVRRDVSPCFEPMEPFPLFEADLVGFPSVSIVILVES